MNVSNVHYAVTRRNAPTLILATRQKLPEIPRPAGFDTGDLLRGGYIAAEASRAPDVILIGEMRDLETTQAALSAALTGHLVFSTLHTNDAPSAITRLIDMGVEPYLITATLEGILAQRLVPPNLADPSASRVRARCSAAGGGPSWPRRAVISRRAGRSRRCAR